MVCAFDALGVEGYYTDRMLLLRADMQVLQAFMKVKCPKVAKVRGGAWGGGWRVCRVLEGLEGFEGG